jgi:hypothetical protein
MDRKAARRLIRLTSLAHAEVQSETGEALGRLVDLRGVHAKGNARPARVDGLFCGTIGWLERFGLRAAGGTMFAWGRVVALDKSRVVVRMPRRRRR